MGVPEVILLLILSIVLFVPYVFEKEKKEKQIYGDTVKHLVGGKNWKRIDKTKNGMLRFIDVTSVVCDENTSDALVFHANFLTLLSKDAIELRAQLSEDSGALVPSAYKHYNKIYMTIYFVKRDKCKYFYVQKILQPRVDGKLDFSSESSVRSYDLSNEDRGVWELMSFALLDKEYENDYKAAYKRLSSETLKREIKQDFSGYIVDPQTLVGDESRWRCVDADQAEYLDLKSVECIKNNSKELVFRADVMWIFRKKIIYTQIRNMLNQGQSIPSDMEKFSHMVKTIRFKILRGKNLEYSWLEKISYRKVDGTITNDDDHPFCSLDASNAIGSSAMEFSLIETENDKKLCSIGYDLLNSQDLPSFVDKDLFADVGTLSGSENWLFLREKIGSFDRLDGYDEFIDKASVQCDINSEDELIFHADFVIVFSKFYMQKFEIMKSAELNSELLADCKQFCYRSSTVYFKFKNGVKYSYAQNLVYHRSDGSTTYQEGHPFCSSDLSERDHRDLNKMPFSKLTEPFATWYEDAHRILKASDLNGNEKSAVRLRKD